MMQTLFSITKLSTNSANHGQLNDTPSFWSDSVLVLSLTRTTWLMSRVMNATIVQAIIGHFPVTLFLPSSTVQEWDSMEIPSKKPQLKHK